MSEKPTTPTSILPTPLRETALAYLGGVFYAIDLGDKYVVAPLRKIAGRIAPVSFPKGRPTLRARHSRRRTG